jgi:TonB-dependent starch-binding outer membrane protein SusC
MAGTLRGRIVSLLIFTIASICDLNAQTVTGTVIDERTEQPMAGVNVLVQNTDSGTITDEDGSFSIRIDYESSTLVFLL